MIWSVYNINLIKNIFNYCRQVLCCARAMELKSGVSQDIQDVQFKESLLRFTYKRCREDTLHYSAKALIRRLPVLAAEPALWQGKGCKGFVKGSVKAL